MGKDRLVAAEEHFSPVTAIHREVIGRMDRTGFMEKPFQLTIRNPAFFAVLIPETLLAGPIYGLQPHRFQMLGDGQIFMRSWAIVDYRRAAVIVGERSGK